MRAPMRACMAGGGSSSRPLPPHATSLPTICPWQDFAKENAEELGVKPVPSLNLVYTQEADYIVADEAKEKGYEVMKLSGTKFRKMLRAGEDIPEWFAFKSVVEVLRAEWK